MNQITVDLVMENGKVDSEASTEAFESALANFVAQRETEVSTLGAAVISVLQSHPGKGIAMPVLTSLALNSINVQPEAFTALGAATLQYIRDNSKGEDSLFVVSKGKNGGCSLRSDTAARKAAK